MAKDFSNSTLTGLIDAWDTALENALKEPEKIDFETLGAVALERENRDRPMTLIQVRLSQDSDIGRRFEVAYLAARQVYPALPEVIGWRGDGSKLASPYKKPLREWFK